jgi:predicted amidohydrolase
MTRVVTVGAAQNGPVTRSENREDSVERLLVQLREAHRRGCDLVVFTECEGLP